MLKNFEDIIRDCISQKRYAQEHLYRAFYPYAITICLPYSHTDFEAEQMVKDGFIKVFTKIKHFEPERPFKPWLRKIMINTAIDHHRAQKKHYMSQDIDTAYKVSDEDLSALDHLAAEELMMLIRRLPPAFKTAFMLYVVEGYKHQEIAGQLDVTEGTSKSNLAKAKARLQQLIRDQNPQNNG